MENENKWIVLSIGINLLAYYLTFAFVLVWDLSLAQNWQEKEGFFQSLAFFLMLILAFPYGGSVYQYLYEDKDPPIFFLWNCALTLLLAIFMYGNYLDTHKSVYIMFTIILLSISAFTFFACPIINIFKRKAKQHKLFNDVVFLIDRVDLRLNEQDQNKNAQLIKDKISLIRMLRLLKAGRDLRKYQIEKFKLISQSV